MGDTQPFIALAVRLKQQGHTVKLAARPDFATLAASYDIDFAPLGNPYKSLLGVKRYSSRSNRYS
jgi:sterol 3beta-glucosyltransferase